MPTLGDIYKGGGLLGQVDRKTCRYHPDTDLIQIGQPLALTEPPPHLVVQRVTSPGNPYPHAQTSPASVAITAWYCPVCTYLELHYVPSS